MLGGAFLGKAFHSFLLDVLTIVVKMKTFSVLPRNGTELGNDSNNR